MALTPERMAAARANGSTRMAGNRWPACALAGAAAGVGSGESAVGRGMGERKREPGCLSKEQWAVLDFRSSE
jgi:hypothetical protein